MAKRNKRKLKQRKKRQLKKVFKLAVKIIAALEVEQPKEPLIVETKKEYPTGELYLGKYEAENKEYQALLDKRYNGTVKPIERFINFHSNILHHCSDCKQEWYSKPLWLLTRVNQEHICGIDTARMNLKKVKKKLSEDDKIKMCLLAQQGMSMTKIANHYGISRPTVISHLRKMGLEV